MKVDKLILEEWFERQPGNTGYKISGYKKYDDHIELTLASTAIGWTTTTTTRMLMPIKEYQSRMRNKNIDILLKDTIKHSPKNN
jgi:hypothetical protein